MCFNGEVLLKIYILKIVYNWVVIYVCKEVKKQEEFGYDNMVWEFVWGNESVELYVVVEQ